MDNDSEISFFHISDVHFDSFYNSTVPAHQAECRRELLTNGGSLMPRSRYVLFACVHHVQPACRCGSFFDGVAFVWFSQGVSHSRE